MKPLLFVLLAASLVANVALIVLSRHPAAPASAVSAFTPGNDAPTPPGQTPSATATKQPGRVSATSATVPMAWPGVSTDQDLHRLVAGLRAAGYPTSIIRAVINQLLNERFAPRLPNAGLPFWKPPLFTPQTVAAQTALNNERRTLFEALLGPDARPSTLLDAKVRERRYGPLSDDKVDAIAKIERDYQEMAAESRAKRLGNTEDNLEAYTQAREMMEKERFADISALLSPEEFAQYEMRNSNSAGAVMNFLQNIDVTEAEYTRLYLAQKAFNAAHPAPDPMKPALFAHWHLEMLARNEEARAVLGDTRFYAYMQEADRTYAGVAQALAKYPTVTSATTYQVYQLQLELQSQLTQITHGGPTPPDKIEEMKNTVAAYNTKLEAAVGPEAAEAFRNHYIGRIFTTPRMTPSPSTSIVPIAK